MPATITKKPSKSNRISTTVRFDPDLKHQAEEFARANHMDFSTFLHLSLSSTMRYGGKIEPMISNERIEFYKNISHGVDTGVIPTEKFDSLEDLRASYTI